MRLLTDFLPILLFFISYKFFGIYSATAIAILTVLIQMAWAWHQSKRLEAMQIATAVSLVVLGTATLVFHNEIFIKWKPTALYWGLASLFLGSQFLASQPLIQRILGKSVTLPPTAWTKLNMSWGLFFVTLGAVNLYVVYHFDTDTWVNFKLFGISGATILFAVAQAVYLTRFMPEKDG